MLLESENVDLALNKTKNTKLLVNICVTTTKFEKQKYLPSSIVEVIRSEANSSTIAHTLIGHSTERATVKQIYVPSL